MFTPVRCETVVQKADRNANISRIFTVSGNKSNWIRLWLTANHQTGSPASICGHFTHPTHCFTKKIHT